MPEEVFGGSGVTDFALSSAATSQSNNPITITDRHSKITASDVLLIAVIFNAI